MQLAQFFEKVITAESGWLNISHSKEDGSEWKEEFFEYPKSLDKVVQRVESLANHNVYFSPYLFSAPKAAKHHAITGRTITADLDGANVLTLRYRPSILVETSHERHQAYWIVEEGLPQDEHESVSKKLTYSIPGCDKSGWWVGHRFRVPNTRNFKWTDQDATVKVVATTNAVLRISELRSLPDVPSPSKNGSAANGTYSTDYDVSDEFIQRAMRTSSGPQEFLETVKDKLPPKLIAQYNYVAEDRSAALWALECAAFRAGLSTEQVFFLSRGSANNKFSKDRLRYHADRELLKDVLRARAITYGSHLSNDGIIEQIKELRRHDGRSHEKLEYLAKKIILEHMKVHGQFINCIDGTTWYIYEEEGKPIPIVERSGPLRSFLENQYGINPTERESYYTISSLVSFVSSLPATGRLGAMSVYDRDSNTLLLHTGRKEVLLITRDDIKPVVNGYDSIVFPWTSSQELIEPYYRNETSSWEEILFNNAMNNIVGMKVEDAKALLKVWVLMLLLRDIAITRPILAIFGQPGAGKSTLFRRIYTLLYGRNRSLSAITTQDDFDYATAANPLVVFDNVDTWEKWLPDRLALAAALSEVVKRKLYTNNELITLKRQAFLGITAHNPKFQREDVTDRLILITLERLTNFTSETEILNYIQANRSAIWGMLIQDLQRILQSPIPTQGYPQFRIEDFSKYGYWIASAVGCAPQFISALNNIAVEQKSFNLEEDQILVDGITAYLERQKRKDASAAIGFKTPSEWWVVLENTGLDDRTFAFKYKNAIVLGKKLWTIQDSIKQVLDVEWKYDKARGSRTWCFGLKTPDNIV